MLCAQGYLCRRFQRGVRVVEGARLESVYTSQGYRGFESLPLYKPVLRSGFLRLCSRIFYRNWPMLVIIPDVHHDWDWVRKILAQYDADTRYVFLGDYLDYKRTFTYDHLES